MSEAHEHHAARGREAEREWRPAARARPLWHWVGVIGWVSAAILAVATGTFWETILRLRVEAGEREERVADLTRRLQVERSWLSILGAPQARTATMIATPAGAPEMHGRAVYDPTTRRAFIVLERMTPPGGKDYELWAIQDGASSSLGVIRPNEVGTAVLRVGNAGDPAVIQSFAVSLEPKGGSNMPAGPAGPIVMTGALRD